MLPDHYNIKRTLDTNAHAWMEPLPLGFVACMAQKKDYSDHTMLESLCDAPWIVDIGAGGRGQDPSKCCIHFIFLSL